jgi:hypothetical protein
VKRLEDKENSDKRGMSIEDVSNLRNTGSGGNGFLNINHGN